MNCMKYVKCCEKHEKLAMSWENFGVCSCLLNVQCCLWLCLCYIYILYMYSLYFITLQRSGTRPVTKPLRSIRPEHRGTFHTQFWLTAIYILNIHDTVKMVEDHCSITEALLSQMCMKHCKAIGSPPKAIMAQNTGKRYGPQKSDNRQ